MPSGFAVTRNGGAKRAPSRGTLARLAIVAIGATSCGRAGGAPPPVPDARVAAVAGAVPDAAPAPPVVEEAETEAPARCESARDVYLFVSPRAPTAGAPLHVVAVTDRPMAAELRVERADKESRGDAGELLVATSARRGASPYFWLAELEAPRAGTYKVRLTQGACATGEGSASRVVTVAVVRDPPPAPPPLTPEDPLWHTRSTWSHHLEQIYSAWIETLFDAPDGEMPSWGALQEVMRDRSRNFLFDYLALGEDSLTPPVMRPDCADLPYYLRAYFAFKLGLPFAIGHCKPGGGGVPPSCEDTMITNEEPPPPARDAGTTNPARFESFLRVTVADNAHSSSARQPFDEQNSDYYPVPLTWESLRPGTVYADPYGHVLVLAKRIPQTSAHGGVLLAVDAQPDGTVARKRYWRGNFLYAKGPELGGPGFKRFRPIARDRRDDAGEEALVRPDDDAIHANHEYADVSREAAALSVEGFYDRLDTVLSPRPLDPERAMRETLGALEEQVRTRVQSVDNGRKWLETAAAPAPMPEEASEIFETVGPWEDFSTPSRDLRILIAIDVVRGFPARVARRPERYTMPAGRTGAEIAADLEKLLDDELRARKITYTRTDGSPFELSLAEVIARGAALEVAYDPNDCVETRWGAPPGSDEAKTCHAQAPPDQRERMEGYRRYFHERRRPPRK
jgi:hypothetical protein